LAFFLEAAYQRQGFLIALLFFCFISTKRLASIKNTRGTCAEQPGQEHKQEIRMVTVMGMRAMVGIFLSKDFSWLAVFVFIVQAARSGPTD
jgi:hypothetical protein